MRNKELEFAWRKVIEACMEDVKHHFDDIQQAIEFGCYIQPTTTLCPTSLPPMRN